MKTLLSTVIALAASLSYLQPLVYSANYLLVDETSCSGHVKVRLDEAADCEFVTPYPLITWDSDTDNGLTSAYAESMIGDSATPACCTDPMSYASFSEAGPTISHSEGSFVSEYTLRSYGDSQHSISSEGEEYCDELENYGMPVAGGEHAGTAHCKVVAPYPYNDQTRYYIECKCIISLRCSGNSTRVMSDRTAISATCGSMSASAQYDPSSNSWTVTISEPYIYYPDCGNDCTEVPLGGETRLRPLRTEVLSGRDLDVQYCGSQLIDNSMTAIAGSLVDCSTSDNLENFDYVDGGEFGRREVTATSCGIAEIEVATTLIEIVEEDEEDEED